VIAFSTTDRDSFDAVASWKRKVEAEVGSIPMALVQNKVRAKTPPPPGCVFGSLNVAESPLFQCGLARSRALKHKAPDRVHGCRGPSYYTLPGLANCASLRVESSYFRGKVSLLESYRVSAHRWT